MKRLNCIIVDDEPLALDILEAYIRRTPALEFVGRFSSSTDALNLLCAYGGDGGQGIDLAFLDIQMPGLDGLELARLTAEAGSTRVVFTTAFPQYALEGFRVDALDYLLKPISFDEFSHAVERATAWFSRDGASPTEVPQTLIVKSEYRQLVIPLSDIVYIEGVRDYIRIHTTNDAGEPESIQTLMSLKTAEETLPANRFARVHRSYIVSLDHVKRLERARAILEGAEARPKPVSVPVSDTYKEAFLRALTTRSL